MTRSHWNGLIDDVAIFDHVLDSTELNNVMTLGAENYAGGGPSAAPGTMIYGK